ncbi:MAG: hypothetical protein ACT4QA_23185 [Panacagrimonas sp.]
MIYAVSETVLRAARRLFMIQSCTPRTRFWRSAIISLALFGPQAWSGEPTIDDTEEKIVVWRSLRNDFHNPNIAAADIAEIVDKTPPRVIRIEEGQTLSGRLQDSFNISATWTPVIYQKMLDRIVDLNNLIDANSVTAKSELLVPQVPRTGKRYFRTPPKVTGQNIKLALDWDKRGIDETSTGVAAPANRAPQSEVQYFVIAKKDLSKYVLDGHTEQGVSGTIPITLEQGGAATTQASDKVLKPLEAQLLRTRLQTPGTNRPKPILIVVDDSIPDNTEYQKTKRFVLQMSSAIRDKYKLGESPFTSDIESLDAKMLEDAATLYPNQKTHSSLIKYSLDEFEALDPLDRIEVVYFPLAHSQLGVAPLLKEVVFLAQFLKLTKPSLPPSLTADVYQRALARSATNSIVDLNSAVFQYNAVAPISSGPATIKTDRMLLESLSIVMSYYSDATGRPHSFSFSWTTPKLDVPAYFQASAYGWKFAAAGNQIANGDGIDLLAEEIQFAARAVEPKDFVVVMNSMGSTGQCPSNLFKDDGLDVTGLAYPGNVNSHFCGTSFSTPRVAWLLAAKEAVDGVNLPAPVSAYTKFLWIAAQRKRILDLRESSSGFFQRYALNVEKLFALN